MNTQHPISTLKISACIITKNEADRIAACLNAIKGLVDEIIVVDSGSSDETLSIAKQLGAKTFHNDWIGYGPQKRFSEDCASHDWILNLDADEVVSQALYDEILKLKSTTPEFKAYRIKLRNVYPGKDKPRLWADYHNYVRLYDRRYVRFRESLVHDTVDTKQEPVGQLYATCVHFSARSYAHIKAKLDSYTNLQATALSKPAWAIILRLPFEYPLVFLRYFLFRCHFTGGLDGIISSHLAAQARFNRLLKMLKINTNKFKAKQNAR